ncbi:xanthine dehydrogenase family protein molybdopterin-binding subunit [Candidatus Eisenbacteria bacterium]|uniref:Xanthine dehydrogenase family protein molybdopterin-binding subunit n=1 Tax=Eiseniibacteriota bacterium TaxID=2212470 RepID=A0ABV6YI62_UNCEI
MTIIEKSTLIGKPIPKLDAPSKVTGEARYLQDIELPGMLHGKILRTDRVHARILSIDTTAAKALRGVHAVITAEDTPGVPLGHGRDNPPLKGDRVRCIRDEVAAVAAESEEIAAEAVRLIKVEYEDLPAVFSPADALKEGAPVIHDAHPNNIPFTFNYDHGDIAKGERESDTIVEDTFRLHFVTHCCMGVSGIIANFDSQGMLTLYSQTQMPFLFKRDLSRIIEVPPEKIRVIQPVIGGAFGSKLDIYPFEPICIFLAKATRRPVRLVYTREEEFLASPTRQPVELTLRSGVRKDGTLTFREVSTLHDNGGHTSWGATTPFVMMQTFSSLYRAEHCRYQTTVVYTNNPYSGAFRGYGNLQATFAVESHMDKLAAAVEMNPFEFRLHNAQECGETTPQGMIFQTCGLRDCLQLATDKSDFVRKHKEYAAGQQGPVKRGIGMASLLHVGGGAKIYHTDGCGTILKIDDYAKVTVMTGSSEIGQGSETVIAQFVAEELGLGVSQVEVINNDSEIRPWDVGVHASRTTFVAGNSALRAARKARQKLLQAAGPKLDANPEDLDLRGGHVVREDTGEALLELGKLIRALHFRDKHEIVVTSEYYEPPSVMQDKEFKGNVSPTYAFGTHVAEVEVDTQTGIVRVVKVTAVHDVGRVINKLGIEGQIEGGVVMGVGYATRENLVVDAGRVMNPSFRDYKLVTAPEIPEIDIACVETMDPYGPAGAKGIGEAPSICISPAIVNAVHNATGVRFYELPLTPEKVLRTLQSAQESGE